MGGEKEIWGSQCFGVTWLWFFQYRWRFLKLCVSLLVVLAKFAAVRKTDCKQIKNVMPSGYSCTLLELMFHCLNHCLLLE